MGLILPLHAPGGADAATPVPPHPPGPEEELDWPRIAAEVLREAVGQAVRWKRAVDAGRTPYEVDEAAAAWLGIGPEAGGITFDVVAELLGRSPSTLRRLVTQEVATRAACLGSKAKRRPSGVMTPSRA